MEVAHSDIPTLSKQALAMAFQDAQTKAAHLAELSGVKLGLVLQVSLSGGGNVNDETEWMQAIYGVSNTGSQPNLIRVKRQLTVRFAIQ